MPWIDVKSPYDWRAGPTIRAGVVSFKPGIQFVKKDAAEAMIQAGAAVAAKRPKDAPDIAEEAVDAGDRS